MVCTLFAPRASDPDGLLGADDPLGLETDAVLNREAVRAARAVMVFGRPHPRFVPRARAVAGCLADAGVPLEVFGTIKEGWPRHLLDLPASARPAPWILSAAVTPTSFGQ